MWRHNHLPLVIGLRLAGVLPLSVTPKKKPSPSRKAPVRRRAPSRASSRASAPSTSTPEAARGAATERIALLIDADNVSHAYLPTLRDFVGETPLASARAYGDFTARLHNWRKLAEEWPALELVEQRNYTAGKNATDMRLTIDAVKLLAGKEPPTTLVFVTNDSDFTPVVEDAKKDGVRIVVMGERPHRALRSAAHHYINLNDLRDRLESKASVETDPREVLRLILVALRGVAKLGAEATEALTEAERRLPLLVFSAPKAASSRAPRPSREPRSASEPAREGGRSRRGRRGSSQQELEGSALEKGSTGMSADAHALRRKEDLLGNGPLIQALVESARSLPSPDGWVKGEFVLRRVRERVPNFDQQAPRYAKFYRLLEDTGRFEVELRGSTVYARPKSD